MVAMLPIRQRELPLPVNALLGALMLGLRRLELTGRAPELDLAVLEETLGYYGYCCPLAMWTSCEGNSVKFIDSRSCAIVRLKGNSPISISGTSSMSRYLLEIVDMTCDMPTGELPPWHVEVGFGPYHYIGGVSLDIPLVLTTEAKSFWLVEWDPARLELTIKLVDGGSLKQTCLKNGNVWQAKRRLADDFKREELHDLFLTPMIHFTNYEPVACMHMQVRMLSLE